MKLPKIKFSHDYHKLPFNCNGTQATLIGVTYHDNIQRIKNSHPQFIEYDTRIRCKGTKHFPIDFEDALVLTFIHINSGLPFTTIRRYTTEKYEYYKGKLWETFDIEINALEG
jgi:hypothetical protein